MLELFLHTTYNIHNGSFWIEKVQKNIGHIAAAALKCQ